MEKIILSFLFGVLLSFLAMFLIWPQYSDYRAMTETSGWLITLIRDNDSKKNLIDAIAEKNIKAQIFSKLNPNPELIKITNSNVLIIKGGREGQLMILGEQEDGGLFCMAGSRNASPKRCNISGI